jgi:hypothetical protein
MLSTARQQGGAVVMCRGKVRVERNGPLEAFKRLALASDGLQGGAELGVRSSILHGETHGLAGTRERFFATSEGG